MSALSAGPGWDETTVRWLEARAPHYLVGSRMHTPANERLEKALRKMTYRGTHGDFNDDVWASLSGPAVDRAYKELAGEWTGEHHQIMTKWVEDGGYSAWKAKYATPPMTFGTTSGTETIELELEMDEPDEIGTEEISAALDSIVRGELSSAPVSEERELQDILEAADKEQDTRYGAW